MIRFQFYGIKTVFFQGKNSKNVSPTNLQPLDLTVNKAAKAFIQNRYDDWFSDQVAWQLKSGNDPTDIKVSSKFERFETTPRQLDS